ncbi:hypothetical protein G6F56_007700 [Rhizopus delemar]|nr:hypothetical protein G6F56_007700 [Rhizopus delemar]
MRSIVIASKFTSDIFYSNSRYAKVGGITLQELNQLELQFLFSVGFRLHVTLEDLQEYADQLLSHAITLSVPQNKEKHSTSYTLASKSLLPLSPPYPSKPKRHHPYQRPNQRSQCLSPKRLPLG